MDWSRWDEDVIQGISFIAYYLTVFLWVALPFIGVAFLIYASFRCGRSYAAKAEQRKHDKFHKEIASYLEKENH